MFTNAETKLDLLKNQLRAIEIIFNFDQPLVLRTRCASGIRISQQVWPSVHDAAAFFIFVLRLN